MKSLIISSVCLAACLASPVLAQEMPLEDLLGWFPDGYYSAVYHFDKTIYLHTCPEEIARDFLSRGNNLLPFSSDHLPPSLAEAYTSVTNASMCRMGLKKNFEIADDGTIIPINRKSAYVFEINGKPWSSWNQTISFVVYRFDNLQALIARCCENSELQSIGETAGNLEIYSLPSEQPGTGYFYCATDTGELLIADSVARIRKMVSAGMEHSYPITQRLNVEQLSDEISDGTFLWTISSELPLLQLSGNYIRARDQESPSLDELDSRMQEAVQTSTLVSSWTIKGQLTRRVISFAGEARAGSYYTELQNSSSSTARLYWTSMYINGHPLSYRGRDWDLAKVRMSAGGEFSLLRDGNRLIETYLDTRDTLLQLLDHLAAGKS